jgi:hypothetical protein
MLAPEEIKHIDAKVAADLLDSIERTLTIEFEKISHLKYNPNTKGSDYEEVLSTFLKKYLNGAFDFFTRAGVLDDECIINNHLKEASNEFDIVAIYQDAVPKVVFERRLVPYDSVAFIIEVKKSLTLPYVKNDLEKFEKLNNIRISQKHNQSLLNRPLRALFYCESQIDIAELNKLLIEKELSWDICTILDKNVVIINRNLPINKMVFKSQEHIWEGKNPLLKGMYFTCTSTNVDISKGWRLYWNLFRSIAPKDGEVLH